MCVRKCIVINRSILHFKDINRNKASSLASAGAASSMNMNAPFGGYGQILDDKQQQQQQQQQTHHHQLSYLAHLNNGLLKNLTYEQALSLHSTFSRAAAASASSSSSSSSSSSAVSPTSVPSALSEQFKLYYANADNNNNNNNSNMTSNNKQVESSMANVGGEHPHQLNLVLSNLAAMAESFMPALSRNAT